MHTSPTIAGLMTVRLEDRPIWTPMRRGLLLLVHLITLVGSAGAADAHEISKFHGWWRNTMIGAMNGFDAGGPYSAIQDQYIFIDTSFDPVRITTTYGTPRFPRLQPSALDTLPIPLPPVPGVPTTNSYFFDGRS
jgi:hypothetical protein